MSRAFLGERINRFIRIQAKHLFPRYLSVVVERRLGETSRDGEIRPPKNQRHEEGPSEPSEGHQTVEEGGKTCGRHVPTTGAPRPSLCSDPSYNSRFLWMSLFFREFSWWLLVTSQWVSFTFNEPLGCSNVEMPPGRKSPAGKTYSDDQWVVV